MGLLACVRNNIYIPCLSSSGIRFRPIIHSNQQLWHLPSPDERMWPFLGHHVANTWPLFRPCCPEIREQLPAKEWLEKLKWKGHQFFVPVNRTVPGKTTLWTLQKHQTPKTQYEQPAQWLCSNSCHRQRYQSLHHSARTVDAQMLVLATDPSNYSASAGTACPFLSGPWKQHGTVQFWQNDTVHNHPEKMVIN